MSRREIDHLTSSVFRVEFDGRPIAHFSAVDGLSAEIEMIEYRDSATPNIPKFRPGRAKPIRVTLKRGVAVTGTYGDNDLFTWVNNYQTGKSSAQPKNITIVASDFSERSDAGLNTNEVTWELSRCYPTKWSVGSLEGTSNSSFIESLELVVSEISKG